MRHSRIVGVLAVVATGILIGTKVIAVPDPLKKPPSFLKFNSVTVKGSAKAALGQALLADGKTGTEWGNVEGANVASNVAGSPAASGALLTADGTGKANWQTPGSTPVSVPHPTFLQAYSISGNGAAANTFTVPQGVTAIQVEAWGAGGGGGGGSGGNSQLTVPGLPGGSGAPGLYIRTVIAVTPGSYTVTVGGGGIQGAGGIGGFTSGPGTLGLPGGATTIAVTGGATALTVAGGGGGGGATGVSVGTAGAAPTAGSSGFQLALSGVAASSSNVLPPMPPNTVSFGGAAGAGGTPAGTNGIAGNKGGDGLVVVSY